MTPRVVNPLSGTLRPRMRRIAGCLLLGTLGALPAPAGNVAYPAMQSATGRDSIPPAPDDTARVFPRPAGAAEHQAERDRMVRDQIASPPDHRDAVSDPRVLTAMRTVPRHRFVPERHRDLAYEDSPLPIGYGQTISQPYIVAVMTELLKLTPASRVLEVGTGSGYQAAVLAHLTPNVYTMEIVEPLASRAARTLEDNGYSMVHARQGDGYYGWPEAAPFDAIIVTCAAGHLPSPLWDQLAPGGRIVIPIGSPVSVQRLVVVTKTADGRRQSDTIMGVRFVPMTGRVEQP